MTDTTVKAVIRNRFTGGVIAEGDDIRSIARQNSANLRDAYLGGAHLGGAYLGDAYLGGAYLGDAYLGGAYLGDAYLGGAYLGDAYLGGANLRGAYLGDANLGGANLRGASVIMGPLDKRGYSFYVTWDRDEASPAPIIRAGCRRWDTFDEARAHYGDDYVNGGDPAECIAAIDYLEGRFNARMADKVGDPE